MPPCTLINPSVSPSPDPVPLHLLPSASAPPAYLRLTPRALSRRHLLRCSLWHLPRPLYTSASPLAPFLDVTFSDALCGTWAIDYAAPGLLTYLLAQVRGSGVSPAQAMNICLPWNRGLLTYLLAQVRGGGGSHRCGGLVGRPGEGEWCVAQAVGKNWTASLHALGIRPPYAFGCILRFLLKPSPPLPSPPLPSPPLPSPPLPSPPLPSPPLPSPPSLPPGHSQSPQPEVISKLQAMYHQLLAPLNSSSSSSPSAPLQHLTTGHPRTSHLSSHAAHGFSHGMAGHRVKVVGIHMRAPDKFVWQGQQGFGDPKAMRFGDPKAMSETDKVKLVAWAENYIACAQGFGDPKVMSGTDKEKLMTWAEDYVACAQVTNGTERGTLMAWAEDHMACAKVQAGGVVDAGSHYGSVACHQQLARA
ncbi:unnamed protein product [Closterium sp. Naga37s-1]|nr:unnamed protein product [Closterium sp. Naga37s-1]